MKSLFTLFSLLVFGLLVFSSSESSHAQATKGTGLSWGSGSLKGSPMTEEISGVVGDATDASRKISYGIGGLGAVALGALAFFGRFQWGWFFGLIGGLALIGLYNVAATNLAGGDVSELKVSN
jgi:hypothetical protein